jgi:hypothetical protein
MFIMDDIVGFVSLATFLSVVVSSTRSLVAARREVSSVVWDSRYSLLVSYYL